MSEFIVTKFGGTSMAQPEVVADIVENRPDHKIIVVSAPGTNDIYKVKTTDLLYRYAGLVAENPNNTKARNLQTEIIDRFTDPGCGAYRSLDSGILAFEKDVLLNQLSPKEDVNQDYYASVGEYTSARMFAKLIGGLVLDPDAIVFDNDGTLNRRRTYGAIRYEYFNNIAGANQPVIMPGFYGYDEFDNPHLLGRGGSDRTGALIAHALEWDYENWTDKDGIFSVDPNKVSAARVVPKLSRDEVREGAHGGSGILQGDTILDLDGSDVTVVIKNTFNPESPGTQVVTHRNPSAEYPVVAVSGRDDLLRIHIRDLGMRDAKNYGERLLKHFGELGLSWEHMPTAQDAMAIMLHENGNQDEVDSFVRFAENNLISPTGKVTKEARGAVYVVGEGLRSPYVVQQYVNVKIHEAATYMGASAVMNYDEGSPSIAYHVKRGMVEPLMQAVHKEFLEHE